MWRGDGGMLDGGMLYVCRRRVLYGACVCTRLTPDQQTIDRGQHTLRIEAFMTCLQRPDADAAVLGGGGQKGLPLAQDGAHAVGVRVGCGCRQ